MRRLITTTAALLLLAAPAAAHDRDVHRSLERDLVAHYDFEHPVRSNPALERDRGPSGTVLELVNGGADMRVRDGAHRSSRTSIQTRQVDPVTAGNDDWKAGIYSPTGVPTLRAFNDGARDHDHGLVQGHGREPEPRTRTRPTRRTCTTPSGLPGCSPATPTATRCERCWS